MSNCQKVPNVNKQTYRHRCNSDLEAGKKKKKSHIMRKTNTCETMFRFSAVALGFKIRVTFTDTLLGKPSLDFL